MPDRKARGIAIEADTGGLGEIQRSWASSRSSTPPRPGAADLRRRRDGPRLRGKEPGLTRSLTPLRAAGTRAQLVRARVRGDRSYPSAPFRRASSHLAAKQPPATDARDEKLPSRARRASDEIWRYSTLLKEMRAGRARGARGPRLRSRRGRRRNCTRLQLNHPSWGVLGSRCSFGTAERAIHRVFVQRGVVRGRGQAACVLSRQNLLPLSSDENGRTRPCYTASALPRKLLGRVIARLLGPKP